MYSPGATPQPEASLPFYATILEDLAQVEEKLRGLADTEFKELGGLLGHVFRTQGKRMRPAVTLLASRLHPGPSDTPVIMGSAVELLHIATLIHDDTVDNASVRHGKATLSSMWGPHVAVLVGDYVFATSATYVCDTGNIRVIRRFSETIMELATGELKERLAANDWHVTREQYEERIYNKTASLFTTAAESGAVLSGAPEPLVQALKTYGASIGMAFQVVDDILDFESSPDQVGKPVGNDLAQGTLTLPAILLIQRYPEDNPVVALCEGKDREANRQRALEMVRNSSIIEESYQVAADFCRKAVEALAPIPDSPHKRALQDIADYVLERHR
jgi:heptaprenyl diphosphate synthase/octaprenyl-diphosphate synthase